MLSSETQTILSISYISIKKIYQLKNLINLINIIYISNPGENNLLPKIFDIIFTFYMVGGKILSKGIVFHLPFHCLLHVIAETIT